MKYSVRLREEAEGDLAVAASWYEQQRSGLGHRFLDEVLSIFHSIATQPLGYPIVYRNTRRALMRRFPFGIYYRVDRNRIVIMAIMLRQYDDPLTAISYPTMMRHLSFSIPAHSILMFMNRLMTSMLVSVCRLGLRVT